MPRAGAAASDPADDLRARERPKDGFRDAPAVRDPTEDLRAAPEARATPRTICEPPLPPREPQIYRRRHGVDRCDAGDSRAMATIDLTLSDDEAAPPAPARRAAPPKRPIGQIDLTAESDDEPPARRARAAPAPARAPVEAPWKNKRGAARMFAEFSELNKWSGSPRVYDVSMVDDRVDMWRFRVKDFDRGTKAGRDLNSDLNALSRLRGGFDHIRMEVSFPQDYPNRPRERRAGRRSAAAGLLWIFRRGVSRRRRGCHVDISRDADADAGSSSGASRRASSGTRGTSPPAARSASRR